MVLFTGYTFEIDLRKYRKSGKVPADTDNPRFYLFLLDRGRDYPQRRLLSKHRGAHPMDKGWSEGIAVRATFSEQRRWTATQNAVLTGMRMVRRDLLRGLRAGKVPVPELLERCQAQILRLSAEHENCYREVRSRVEERLPPMGPPPGPLVVKDTPERRATRERNRRAMGYYN